MMMNRILDGVLWAAFTFLVLEITSRIIGMSFGAEMLVMPFIVGVIVLLDDRRTVGG